MSARLEPGRLTRRRMQDRTEDNGLSAFLSVRSRLFGLAYRMLGSASEAEDIVQDVWIRWQKTDRCLVRDAAAFLVTTATRLAINVMQSARSRREAYIGLWLSEPVGTSANPGVLAERGEGLELAVLILLEKLSPAERAAYVLREAFDYSYREIAGVLRLKEANTRQLVTRARKHIGNARHAPVSSRERRRLLDGLLAATQRGDFAALEDSFSSELSPSHGSPREAADWSFLKGEETVPEVGHRLEVQKDCPADPCHAEGGQLGGRRAPRHAGDVHRAAHLGHEAA